jgi:hypothetical protein
LAHTTAAIGQSPVNFEFGVRAGVPLMKNLRPRPSYFGNFIAVSTFEKPLYTAGPTLGAILYDRISVQFEALYKPVESRSSFSSPAFTSSSSIRGSSWEFPLLVNYRFLRGPIRPYGGVGIVIGEIVSTVNKTRTTDSTRGTETHSEAAFTRFFGQAPAYIVDAGVEWPVSHLMMRPEVRFSRWSHNQPNVAFRDAKQFEFLIGLSFRAFPSSSR